MSKKKHSKLLSAEPDWPDERDKHRRIGIPAVRAAMMAKTGRPPNATAEVRERAEKRRSTRQDRR
jgi:hypothetical protein